MTTNDTAAPEERPSFVRMLVAAAGIFLAVLGLAAVVAMGVRFRQAHGSSPRVTLPGGMQIEFLGTAPGSTEFSSDQPWMKLLRKVLPAKLQPRLLPARFSGTCGSGSNGLTLYFRVTGAGPAGPIGWSDYVAQDDTGFRYDRGGGYCSFGSGGKAQVVGLNLQAYPRREKNFLFQLLNSSNAVIASFRIQNTNTGPFPEWQPVPLPQSVTNGPASVTLKGFERRQWGNSRDIIPKWELKSGQPGWSNSTIRYYTFLDATGNDGRNLSPKETAWKLRAQVMRPQPGDYGAGEKLVITNLPIPAAGNFVSIDHSNLASGVGIAALVLCGPGDFEITNGTSRSMPPGMQTRTGSSFSSSGSGTNITTSENWGFTNSFFLVEVTNAQPGDELKGVQIAGRVVSLRTHVAKLTQGGGKNFDVVIIRLMPGAIQGFDKTRDDHFWLLLLSPIKCGSVNADADLAIVQQRIEINFTVRV